MGALANLHVSRQLNIGTEEYGIGGGQGHTLAYHAAMARSVALTHSSVSAVALPIATGSNPGQRPIHQHLQAPARALFDPRLDTVDLG